MKRITLILSVVFGIVLLSCQNEKIENNNDDLLSEKGAQIILTETTLESAAIEMEYEVDFYANAEDLLAKRKRSGKLWKWTNRLRYRINQCPEVNISSEEGGYPKTITLDYGDGTELGNGKVLRGVVVVEISAPRKSENYNRQVTYTDFGVDYITINGTSVVTIDRGEDVIRTIESVLSFTLDDGSVINRSSERTWQWLEGMNTETDQTDDKIQITGFALAENPDGDVYRKDIVEPLIRIRDCRYIVQGIVEVTLNNELASSMDYGNGECNSMAILIKDGESIEIDLSKKHKKKDN